MNSAVEDLYEKLWERFKTPLSPQNNPEFLEKMKLASPDEDGALHSTVGGLLMSCESPERFISNAFIQAVCYRRRSSYYFIRKPEIIRQETGIHPY